MYRVKHVHYRFQNYISIYNKVHLGGRFTTLEGLLQQAYEQLWGRIYNPDSDSSTSEEKEKFATFLERMKDAIDGKMSFTLIMDDPLSASYIQNLYAPDEDPNMTIEEYQRTREQDEDLGIADMQVKETS